MITGRITYVTTLTSTPVLPPLMAADVFALTDVFAESLPAGSVQDLFLYWGYLTLDPYYTDQRNVSQSAAGVADVVNFGSTTGFKFSLPNVVQDRNAAFNEYSIIASLNDELMNGVVVTWYPDYVGFPAEYYSCIAEKRLPQKRMLKMVRYQFDFDFRILPTVQVPSTVPPFVIA